MSIRFCGTAFSVCWTPSLNARRQIRSVRGIAGTDSQRLSRLKYFGSRPAERRDNPLQSASPGRLAGFRDNLRVFGVAKGLELLALYVVLVLLKS
jgi:hypothetical protein